MKIYNYFNKSALALKERVTIEPRPSSPEKVDYKTNAGGGNVMMIRGNDVNKIRAEEKLGPIGCVQKSSCPSG